MLDRCISPIITFRAPRWPFCLESCRKLDILQRKMIRLAVPPRRLASETDAEYSRRSAHAVTDLQNCAVPWGVRWACSVVNWAAHVIRNTAQACWSARVLHIKSSSEVDRLRSTSQSHRPGTRIEAGFSCRRWTDGVFVACNIVKQYTVSARPYKNQARRLSFDKLHQLLLFADRSVHFIEQNRNML